VFAACGPTDSRKVANAETAASGPNVSQRYADTATIRSRVDSIDREVDAKPQKIKLYAKVLGNARLVAVKDSASWPDETEASYNIVFDASRHPVLHREIPTSQSGDWYAVQSRYFAPDGRTIFYEFSISGFSGCPGLKILRETKRVFLDRAGKVMSESQSFADGDNKPVRVDSTCFRRSDKAPAPKRWASELPFPAEYGGSRPPSAPTDSR
jgi:hypothetical protein